MCFSDVSEAATAEEVRTSAEQSSCLCGCLSEEQQLLGTEEEEEAEEGASEEK